jgi:Collagen triple helix repeat (20 copies)
MKPVIQCINPRMLNLGLLISTVALLAACGGADGSSGVGIALRTSVEPVGNNCAAGGNRVQAGSDTNGNGALEDAEVTNTGYVCNGTAGAAGANGATGVVGLAGATGATGATGPTGAVGPQGPIGSPGTSAQVINGLIRRTTIVGNPNATTNTQCQLTGGLLIEVGLDSNPTNGQLDATEVTDRQYICTVPVPVP